MKLTIENLRAIIKEELEDVQQPCANLHPKIKSLLIKEDFKLFIQAIELYITINQLNVEIVYTEEKFKDKRDEQLGNKQFFFILEGSYEDVRKLVMCLKLDKLRSGVQDFSLDNFHFYAFVKYIGDGHTYNFLESHGYKPPDNDEDELLEQMQQPCPPLHPKIKELLLSGVKDAIVQGFELFSALTELDIQLETRTGPAAVNPKDQTSIADPRVHIEVTGPDTEKFIRCMHFDKLVSPGRLEKMIADNHLKMSFIPTGMRYNVFKQSLENK